MEYIFILSLSLSHTRLYVHMINKVDKHPKLAGNPAGVKRGETQMKQPNRRYSEVSRGSRSSFEAKRQRAACPTAGRLAEEGGRRRRGGGAQGEVTVIHGVDTFTQFQTGGEK